MVLDELFYYLYFDCEDCCVLFYVLVKVLFDVLMIVIVYDDYLMVVVVVFGIWGDIVKYDGKLFVFCDFMGLQVLVEIGCIL